VLRRSATSAGSAERTVRPKTAAPA
jgi:hypothetical protein